MLLVGGVAEGGDNTVVHHNLTEVLTAGLKTQYYSKKNKSFLTFCKMEPLKVVKRYFVFVFMKSLWERVFKSSHDECQLCFWLN